MCAREKKKDGFLRKVGVHQNGRHDDYSIEKGK